MANVKYSLDTRRQRKDGTYPLIIRLSVKDKTLPIKTPFTFLASDWDADKNAVKRSYTGTSSIKRLNIQLSETLIGYKNILEQLESTKELYRLDIHEIRSKLVQKTNHTSIAEFCATIELELRKRGKIGTAKSYNETLVSMQSFDARPLVFADITYAWLNHYETFYLEKGNTINGLAVRMRTIRAMYNKAIKAGFASLEAYPFKHYTIKTLETKRRALQHSDLKKLLNYSPETASETRALDYFFISYYLRGMNFSDMAHCTVSQIQNGVLKYTRKKTKKHFIMQLPKAVLPILGKYTADKSLDDYILPIITKSDDTAIYAEISDKLRNCNKRLKKIAIKLGLQETNITTYVARHTYATQAKKKGVPIAAISDMLGHKSLAITETYLNSFSNEELDSWSERVFED